MNNWQKTTLKEISRVVTGKTPPTDSKEFFGGVFPFITPTDIQDGVRYCDPERSISDKGKEYQKNILFPANAICYTSIASVGKICITKKPSFTNQQINSVIADKEKADYIFIYYLLQYLTPYIKSIAGGTMTSIVNKTQFENFSFSLPPIPTQRAIAGVLSGFDDKIELLRAENKTLENIAQTIFKEWFVKDESNLPAGWRGGKLGEYVGELISGEWGKDTADEIHTERIICLRGTDLPDLKMGVSLRAPHRYVKKDKFDKVRLVHGDIIVEISGGTADQSTGRVAYFINEIRKRNGIGFVASNFCKILRLKNIDIMPFFYFYWEYLYGINLFFNFENGSTGIKNLNLKGVLSHKVVLPNEEKMAEFAVIGKDCLVKIQSNNSQIQILAKLRDTLMGGEVEVK